MTAFDKSLDLIGQKLRKIEELPLFDFDQIPIKDQQLVTFLQKSLIPNGFFDGFYHFKTVKDVIRAKLDEIKNHFADLRQQLTDISQNNIVDEPDIEEINIQNGIDQDTITLLNFLYEVNDAY